MNTGAQIRILDWVSTNYRLKAVQTGFFSFDQVTILEESALTKIGLVSDSTIIGGVG